MVLPFVETWCSATLSAGSTRRGRVFCYSQLSTKYLVMERAIICIPRALFPPKRTAGNWLPTMGLSWERSSPFGAARLCFRWTIAICLLLHVWLVLGKLSLNSSSLASTTQPDADGIASFQFSLPLFYAWPCAAWVMLLRTLDRVDCVLTRSQKRRAYL